MAGKISTRLENELYSNVQFNSQPVWNKTIERINYLILNKNTVYFVEEKTSGSIITFEAKINTIEYKNGTILKLKSYGTWALTNNVEIKYWI